MLQRGGELGNEVTGRFAGISVGLCLVLVSVSSHLSMCDTSESYARAQGLSAFPQGTSSPPKAAMTSRYFSPFNRKQCCLFSCNLPFP